MPVLFEDGFRQQPNHQATTVDYHDKIFQLSYDIPRMTIDGTVELLTHVAHLDQREADTRTDAG